MLECSEMEGWESYHLVLPTRLAGRVLESYFEGIRIRRRE